MELAARSRSPLLRHPVSSTQ